MSDEDLPVLVFCLEELSAKSLLEYRKPDDLGNAAQELDRLTGGVYQKVGGSREIGKHLSLEADSNRSTSFRVFIEGLKRIVTPYVPDQGAT